MGTNYYHHQNCCEHCGRPEKIEHIGKSSGGWTFSFHATDTIRSWKDWQIELTEPNSKIYDEYHREVPYPEFFSLVEEKKQEKRNHSICYPDREDGNFLDDEGNSFSKYEFC